MIEHQFDFIDLFAGIGGFHHAMSDLGGRCVMACEIDANARRVYGASFPEMDAAAIVADIRSITRNADGSDRAAKAIDLLVPDHEVLCAGFPCQPFSKSGFQLGVLDSTRGTLFFDIMQIVLAKRPRLLVLENVRNLAGPRHESTWRTIVSSLRGAGYRVADDPVVFSPHLLPPWRDGAPQVRERVFVLAERVDDAGARWSVPLVDNEPVDGWSPDRWRVEDLLDDDDSIEDVARYQLRPEEQAWLAAWNAFVQMIPDEHLPGFPIWIDSFAVTPDLSDDMPMWKQSFVRKNSEFYVRNRRVIDAWMRQRWEPTGQRVAEFPPSRRKFEWQARHAQPTRDERDLMRLVIQLRPSGIRVRPPTYLPALVAITQTSIIGSRGRRITPQEAAKLQGIPPDVFAKAGVDDATAYKQLGNAVNVGAVKYVARALFEASDRSQQLELAAAAAS